MLPANATDLSPERAADLAELIELEARWENLRAAPARTAEVRATSGDLHAIQRAYEAFRTKLAKFNRSPGAGHVPEALLNTPARLGDWCRRTGELFRRVEQDQKATRPVHALEKAYRCADKLAGRLGAGAPSRPATDGAAPTQVEELEALGRWCDGLAGPALGAA